MFSRLTHFIKYGQHPRDYAVPRGHEATLHPNYTLTHATHRGRSGTSGDGGGGGSKLGPGTAMGRRRHHISKSSNSNKVIKLLRRPTNRQQYPPGLKLCLRAWAEAAFGQPPLTIWPEMFNAPLLALSKHYEGLHGSGGINISSRSSSRKRNDGIAGRVSRDGDPTDQPAAAALFALGEYAWGSSDH